MSGREEAIEQKRLAMISISSLPHLKGLENESKLWGVQKVKQWKDTDKAAKFSLPPARWNYIKSPLPFAIERLLSQISSFK